MPMPMLSTQSLLAQEENIVTCNWKRRREQEEGQGWETKSGVRKWQNRIQKQIKCSLLNSFSLELGMAHNRINRMAYGTRHKHCQSPPLNRLYHSGGSDKRSERKGKKFTAKLPVQCTFFTIKWLSWGFARRIFYTSHTCRFACYFTRKFSIFRGVFITRARVVH